jgi:phage replication-related protein YjqB (UPF0714/DUF867 family)
LQSPTPPILILCLLAEPCSYQEVLDRGHVPGLDLRITFGDTGIAECLLVAPHGGGIEPGTSELLRAISELGGWAWYEFAGFLRSGNHDALHIASTLFDEPTLLALLQRTNFALTLHGTGDASHEVVYVGGRWDAGRATIATMINATTAKHGIHAVEGPEYIRGTEPTNLANRGKLGYGIQLEFSRAARNLLFPPDCSRQVRGLRSRRVSAIARAIHKSLQRLVRV